MRGVFVDYVRNPDYFVKGHHIDGIRYLVVVKHQHAHGRAAGGPGRRGEPQVTGGRGSQQLRSAVPGMVITRVGINSQPCCSTTPSRTSTTCACGTRSASASTGRRFVSHLPGRRRPGSALAPPPVSGCGSWPRQIYLRGHDKAHARALLAEAGWAGQSPQARRGHPQPGDLPRRRRRWSWTTCNRSASRALYEMMNAPVVRGSAPARVPVRLEHHRVRRRRFPIRSSPRASCASKRDLRLLRRGSGQRRSGAQELDSRKRQALLVRIQEVDAARPVLSWRYDYSAHWPPSRSS